MSPRMPGRAAALALEGGHCSIQYLRSGQVEGLVAGRVELQMCLGQASWAGVGGPARVQGSRRGCQRPCRRGAGLVLWRPFWQEVWWVLRFLFLWVLRAPLFMWKMHMM